MTPASSPELRPFPHAHTSVLQAQGALWEVGPIPPTSCSPSILRPRVNPETAGWKLRGSGAAHALGVAPIATMLDRAGYRALPLGDFDRFQQSSLGFLGAQKGCLSPERGSVGPGAGEWPPARRARGTAVLPGPVSASWASER